MALTESLPMCVPRAGASAGSYLDCALVRLSGEHDPSTTGVLCEAFAKAIGSGVPDLIVDLSEVAFMDASTLGIIVRAQQHLEARGGTLVLRSPSPCATRLLAVCGLTHLVRQPDGSLGAAPSPARLEVCRPIRTSDPVHPAAVARRTTRDQPETTDRYHASPGQP